jgi:hypothetical protein
MSGSGLCRSRSAGYRLQVQVLGVQLQPQAQGAQLQGLQEQLPHSQPLPVLGVVAAVCLT